VHFGHKNQHVYEPGFLTVILEFQPG